MEKELDDGKKKPDALIQEVKDFIRLNGLDYDLDEWLTTKASCEKFGIENTQTVNNWIIRGIISSQNVTTV